MAMAERITISRNMSCSVPILMSVPPVATASSELAASSVTR